MDEKNLMALKSQGVSMGNIWRVLDGGQGAFQLDGARTICRQEKRSDTNGQKTIESWGGKRKRHMK